MKLKLKLRMTRLRRLLASGTLETEDVGLARVMTGLANFLIGFAMACAAIMGDYGPFGISAVAATGPGIAGLLCMLGSGLGYLVGFGFQKGLKYVSAVVLVYTVSYISQEQRFFKRSWYMPLVSALFTVVTGALGTLDLSLRNAVLPILGESVLAAGGTVFFREALSVRERNTEAAEMRYIISISVFLGCFLVALSRMTVARYVSVGRIFALLAVMTAAFQGSAVTGAAFGTALGAAMDLAAGQSPFFAAEYALTGLIASLFARFSRLAFALCTVLLSLVGFLWAGGGLQNVGMAFEGLAAGLVFMLLPAKVLDSAGILLRPQEISGSESALRRYTAKRLDKMSLAFRDLYETVDRQLGGEHNDEDMSKVFDAASEKLCVSCPKRQECWVRDYMDTLAVFSDMTPIIKARGSISPDDLPKHFAEKCGKVQELTEAVNSELRAKAYRRKFSSRLSENRSAAYSQYADISKILEEVSLELSNAYGPDRMTSRRILRYLKSEAVDADCAVFRDRSGRLHIILEGVQLEKITEKPNYLDEMSAVCGVRLCRPATDTGSGRIVLMEAEPYAAHVGIASMKKKGEKVSGDAGTYFKTDRGELCIILSDGMGSGEGAAQQSADAVRILERFLRSGVEPQVAMRMLNSMMLLKNGEEWGFATVDLMCVNLFSGEAGFYKYGAAPSYVRNGRGVKRVHSESLAAGLTAGENSEPDAVMLRLKPGDVALIASDGVIAETEEKWVKDLLSESSAIDAKEIARCALKNAYRRYGSSDDMTVLAVRLEQRQ